LKKSHPRAFSASIEFPYLARRDAGRWRHFPVITAEILLTHGVYPLRFLFDSGADCTMLQKSHGELLGLDFKRLPSVIVRGIAGGGIKAYRSSVTLRIDKRVLPPIPCLYADSDTTPLLLGREGFFDLFNITLDNRRKKTVLTPLHAR
jgi:hypothetical protein